MPSTWYAEVSNTGAPAFAGSVKMSRKCRVLCWLSCIWLWRGRFRLWKMSLIGSTQNNNSYATFGSLTYAFVRSQLKGWIRLQKQKRFHLHDTRNKRQVDVRPRLARLFLISPLPRRWELDLWIWIWMRFPIEGMRLILEFRCHPMPLDVNFNNKRGPPVMRSWWRAEVESLLYPTTILPPFLHMLTNRSMACNPQCGCSMKSCRWLSILQFWYR